MLKLPTDRYILEYLDDKRRDVPKNIADNIDRHPGYVSARLSSLEPLGLVKNSGASVYVVTDRGQSYLDGDLSLEDLE